MHSEEKNTVTVQCCQMRQQSVQHKGAKAYTSLHTEGLPQDAS